MLLLGSEQCWKAASCSEVSGNKQCHYTNCSHLRVIPLDIQDLRYDLLPKVLVHQSSAGELCVEACLIQATGEYE